MSADSSDLLQHPAAPTAADPLPLQIFLAEDNPGDVYLVREALNEAQLHYTLAVVQDGERAIQYLERLLGSTTERLPDLIMLDLNLPKIEGDLVLERLRKHREYDQVPVIIVTSSDSSRERARLESLGAARYFRKPVNLTEFLSLGALVREVISQRSNT